MSASESNVQSRVKLIAAAMGAWLMRNNSGAFADETGRQVRFGLGNDSPRINKVFKSSDLIGIRPVVITPDMVGRTVGIFYARECKPEGWRYAGTDREKAQKRFIDRVNELGGDAAFTDGTNVYRLDDSVRVL